MNKTPKAAIAGFDQDIQNDYDRLLKQRRELISTLASVRGQIGQDLINGGAAYAAGKSIKEYTSRIPDLRLEAEIIQAAIDHLGGQADLLKRVNSWL